MNDKSKEKIVIEIPIGYVADAIIQVKINRFNDNFVTLDELYLIANLIEKREKNTITFIPIFDTEYFNIVNEIIIRNLENESTKTLELVDENIKNVLYDEDFIYWCLVEIINQKLFWSVEHRCVKCLTPSCTGKENIARTDENGCEMFQYDFNKNINVLLDKEDREQISLYAKSRVRKNK